MIPPPQQLVAWAFRGVDPVNVQCPRALETGTARIVGKRYDPDAGAYVLADEPTRYALPKRDAVHLRAFFAKALRLGHLLPADAATAAAFGVSLPPAPTSGVTDG